MIIAIGITISEVTNGRPVDLFYRLILSRLPHWPEQLHLFQYLDRHRILALIDYFAAK